MSKWTKSEARRRMKVAVAIACEALGYSSRRSARVEVGERRITHCGKTLDEAKQARVAAAAAGDDFTDFAPVGDYIPQPGEMVHLYIRPLVIGGLADDFDTRVVWIGVGDAEPVVVGH